MQMSWQFCSVISPIDREYKEYMSVDSTTFKKIYLSFQKQRELIL